MSLPAPRHRYTFAEYLELEDVARVRHAFYKGEIYVLSDGTAEYDRGEKLQHYQQIPSLAAVVLVDHRSPRIELWSRGEESWSCTPFGAGDVMPLDAIQCSLPVDVMYAAAREA